MPFDREPRARRRRRVFHNARRGSLGDVEGHHSLSPLPATGVMAGEAKWGRDGLNAEGLVAWGGTATKLPKLSTR
eukprot:8131357-Pyramimonas_sp.AAC.1